MPRCRDVRGPRIQPCEVDDPSTWVVLLLLSLSVALVINLIAAIIATVSILGSDLWRRDRTRWLVVVWVVPVLGAVVRWVFAMS